MRSGTFTVSRAARCRRNCRSICLPANMTVSSSRYEAKPGFSTSTSTSPGATAGTSKRPVSPVCTCWPSMVTVAPGSGLLSWS